MHTHIKTKAVAIAKDEAAYIPEWIFHHLHFGFDSLEVLLNRTSDNSEEILKKISSIYKNVQFSSYDWIDLASETARGQLQYIAYAHAYQKAIDEGFTHILFIDIDELWTPLDFKTKINSFLYEFPKNASISFNWLCELGFPEAFSGVDKNFSFFINSHVKTIVNKESKIKSIKIHSPIFDEGATHVMADGQNFIPKGDNAQFHKEEITKTPKAFIIHRMYRSEVEYLACLYRGNPNGKEHVAKSLKNNRHGYKKYSQNMDKIIFSEPLMYGYCEGMSELIKNCELEKDLELARSYVAGRAQLAISSVKEIAKHDLKLAKKILSGCQNVEALRIINANPQKMYCRIDQIKQESHYLNILGWAFAPYSRTPLCFDITPLPEENVDFIWSYRPDVLKEYPDAQPDCGFKLKIKLNDEQLEQFEKGSIPFDIVVKELESVCTNHGGMLFYDFEEDLLCHLSPDKTADKALYPVFFTKNNDKDLLAIYYKRDIFVLCISQNSQVYLKDLGNVQSNEKVLERKMINNKDFSIICGNNYTCALPGGGFAYDRTSQKDWEVFAYKNIHQHISRSLF